MYSDITHSLFDFNMLLKKKLLNRNQKKNLTEMARYFFFFRKNTITNLEVPNPNLL